MGATSSCCTPPSVVTEQQALLQEALFADELEKPEAPNASVQSTASLRDLSKNSGPGADDTDSPNLGDRLAGPAGGLDLVADKAVVAISPPFGAGPSDDQVVIPSSGPSQTRKTGLCKPQPRPGVVTNWKDSRVGPLDDFERHHEVENMGLCGLCGHLGCNFLQLQCCGSASHVSGLSSSQKTSADTETDVSHASELCHQLLHPPCCGNTPTQPPPNSAESGTICNINTEGVSRSFHCVTGAAKIIAKRQLKLMRLSRNAAITTPSSMDIELEKVNEKCAQSALDLILELKGYYIKAAQTLCGAGQLPKEMEAAFAVLLDQCPEERFDVVQGIVEKELGCKLGEIFREFDRTPIAAASIGQVHFATLHNGKKVAVKVQYPAVEKYFRMDMRTVSLAMRVAGMGEKVKKVFEVMEESFAQEFDYTKEASVMREVAENVLPKYSGQVTIPLPLDDHHPFVMQQDIPRRDGTLVKTLCTRKVLTMERLDGQPIKVYTKEMLEMFAQMNGTTAEELDRQIEAAKKDPTKLDSSNKAIKMAMNMGEVSERQSSMLIVGVKLRNLTAKLLGSFMGCMCSEDHKPTWVKKKLREPLNGPKTAKLLFDVHGHEIFQNGLFNSDPHAGNVFMMSDGKLGLIDYGACMRLTDEQRTNIAKMLVAIADEDDDAVPAAFHACGFKSKNNDWRLALLLAHVFFNRGPFPYDMNRLSPKVGLPRDADILTLDQYIRGGKLDEIVEFPGHLVMLQRCCMVLSGLGMELGAGRLSSAAMLKPQALKWLERQPKHVQGKASNFS